ncbi:hypothetical protein NA57DRAFT_78408 [Rhizodiscina lignyota]|uniref:Uncharacterized protein n=1 Tax=Rhizodiscina lignyota TaxID=1504668 RepID=A0A9P4I7V1_9PEZI|nr:hypothetical protein NA57DRAFT_78408 [Rhizodiscina lignyota]
MSSDDVQRNLLSTPSDSDFSTTTTPRFSGPASPRSPGTALVVPRHRPGYARIGSNDGRGIPEEDDDGDEYTTDITEQRTPSGLGIDNVPDEAAQGNRARRVSVQSVPRKSIGVVSHKKADVVSPDYPAGQESPKSTRASIQALSPTTNDGPVPPGISISADDGRRSRDGISHRSQKSITSLSEAANLQVYEDQEPLRRNAAPSLRSTRSAYDLNGFDPRAACPADVNFEHSRFNWFGVSMLILSIFSTIFSGIYFVIAARAPRYGHFVGTNARLSSSTASILTTLFAKLIELSYVTVFVAFLGQALSRRAFMAKERGVSLAEWSMRSWIMQPGSMITNYETLRYAAVTVLGACALVASITALLYTTAADALVAPQLKFDNWRPVLMQGPVKTIFADVAFIEQQCETPITANQDSDVTTPDIIGATCNQIQHAAQGYHNYQKYLAIWSEVAKSGMGSSDPKARPAGVALLQENTTITGSWIDIVDVANASAKFNNRIINNVSLAMPHAGVSTAAYDARNGILQPKDLDGLGVYNIRASVPSPVVDVLCANVEEDDIKDIVYMETSAGKTKPLNPTTYPAAVDFGKLNNFSITTPLDDIFGWGPENQQHPPMFLKLPIAYNTVLNQTFDYGRESIYLLGRGGPSQNNQLFLCQLQARQTPHCSTNFTATSSGATMVVDCDPNDPMAYIRSLRNASDFNSTTSKDWPSVASEWGNSLSLNAGISDGNASNARLLTELALAGPTLNPALPSPAEALAALAGNTLLMSTEYAPFVEFFNYSTTILDTPQYQYFNASIRAQQYASGGVFAYQKGFYIVLFVTFFTNVLVLIYFLVHNHLVTDFSEPPNLFTLAVNSPPSRLLAGSCGGGPKGHEYAVKWRIGEEGSHLHVVSEEPRGFKPRPVSVTSFEMDEGTRGRSSIMSPISRTYSKYSRRRSRL